MGSNHFTTSVAVLIILMIPLLSSSYINIMWRPWTASPSATTSTTPSSNIYDYVNHQYEAAQYYFTSFQNLKCNGTYNRGKFIKLTTLCEDCYNQYKILEVYDECKRNCFNSEHFGACIELLQKMDEIEDLKRDFKMIHGVPVPPELLALFYSSYEDTPTITNETVEERRHS